MSTLIDIVTKIGTAFFYALFIAVWGSPVFFFCFYVVFRKIKNFKVIVILSLIVTLAVMLAVLYVSEGSHGGEDVPMRRGRYPWFTGFCIS